LAREFRWQDGERLVVFGRGALDGAVADPPGKEQPRGLVCRQRRDRVRGDHARRLDRMPERVEGARRELGARLGRRERGIDDHDGRPHTRGGLVDAARVPVPAGHLRARQRGGNRHGAGPSGGGQRLHDVDHPPATKRHEPVAGDLP
jgi:hypothetical protein